jgi:hypothetical protein
MVGSHFITYNYYTLFKNKKKPLNIDLGVKEA